MAVNEKQSEIGLCWRVMGAKDSLIISNLYAGKVY